MLPAITGYVSKLIDEIRSQTQRDKAVVALLLGLTVLALSLFPGPDLVIERITRFLLGFPLSVPPSGYIGTRVVLAILAGGWIGYRIAVPSLVVKSRLFWNPKHPDVYWCPACSRHYPHTMGDAHRSEKSNGGLDRRYNIQASSRYSRANPA